MKIDRLIGILSILLQNDKCTISLLADRFEVSIRTISRDIDSLCRAGIPLQTRQGQNGGVSIMDGYRIDKTLLTKTDLQSILAGLSSLDSICDTKKYHQVMGKLSVSADPNTASHFRIDLASWYRQVLVPKITLLTTAIENSEQLTFTYYAPDGESLRTVEPYELVFKWSSWYLYGYCISRQDFRLFKLNRMQELHQTCDTFTPRALPENRANSFKGFPETLHATIKFEPSVKWRLVDQFGPDSFTEQPDGTLLFSTDFSDRDTLFSFLLSFGNTATLTEPEEFRSDFVRLLKTIYTRYET